MSTMAPARRPDGCAARCQILQTPAAAVTRRDPSRSQASTDATRSPSTNDWYSVCPSVPSSRSVRARVYVRPTSVDRYRWSVRPSLLRRSVERTIRTYVGRSYLCRARAHRHPARRRAGRTHSLRARIDPIRPSVGRSIRTSTDR